MKTMETILVLALMAWLAGMFIANEEIKEDLEPLKNPKKNRELVEKMNDHRRSIGVETIQINEWRKED